MPTYERIGYGSPDGSQWPGTSSEAIGFYGAIPVQRIALGGNVTSATHASTVISSLISALVSTGLFTVST